MIPADPQWSRADWWCLTAFTLLMIAGMAVFALILIKYYN